MRAVSAGGTLMPLRQLMPLPSGGGALAWMPGYVADPECFGIKLLSLFPGNPSAGLSSHVGLYVLYEAEHGRPLAMLEASALTAVRTAAASVVATRALARRESRVLAIVGTGEEARSHVEAFQAVRPFERLLVWGRRGRCGRRARCSRPHAWLSRRRGRRIRVAAALAARRRRVHGDRRGRAAALRSRRAPGHALVPRWRLDREQARSRRRLRRDGEIFRRLPRERAGPGGRAARCDQGRPCFGGAHRR